MPPGGITARLLHGVKLGTLVDAFRREQVDDRAAQALFFDRGTRPRYQLPPRPIDPVRRDCGGVLSGRRGRIPGGDRRGSAASHRTPSRQIPGPQRGERPRLGGEGEREGLLDLAGDEADLAANQPGSSYGCRVTGFSFADVARFWVKSRTGWTSALFSRQSPSSARPPSQPNRTGCRA
jgi:hypothetical protein